MAKEQDKVVVPLNTALCTTSTADHVHYHLWHVLLHPLPLPLAPLSYPSLPAPPSYPSHLPLPPSPPSSSPRLVGDPSGAYPLSGEVEERTRTGGPGKWRCVEVQCGVVGSSAVWLCVVRCGWVQCGAVWCGVVVCSAVWMGAVWCGVEVLLIASFCCLKWLVL